jgi:hypothetical protein
VIAGQVSEAAFQQVVVDYARLRRWRFTHFRPARTRSGWSTPIEGDAGFPDLVLVRRGRLVLPELKSETGAPSADQLAWFTQLALVEETIRDRCDGWSPVEAHIWRPSDWPRIEEVLR